MDKDTVVEILTHIKLYLNHIKNKTNDEKLKNNINNCILYLSYIISTSLEDEIDVEEELSEINQLINQAGDILCKIIYIEEGKICDNLPRLFNNNDFNMINDTMDFINKSATNIEDIVSRR